MVLVTTDFYLYFRFAKFLNDNEHFTSEELETHDQFEVTNDISWMEDSQTDSHDSAIVVNREEAWLTDDETRGSSISSLCM